MQNEFGREIRDFLVAQEANASSPLAAKLALALREAIRAYREDGNDSRNAFSADASYSAGEFDVAVSFKEDSRMTILYHEDTDPIVQSLWLGLPEAEEELARLAGLMLSEGWVEGYKE
ncbi:hypothetical protein [Delftia tsuruhatensis]|uniref:hypothetical protein n=1 Tax=Delftia tsuruhatensis TaxID=180282 RepID=UPI0024497B23|nr:hypothetical protein [Delftia tsuruhatensis]MDH0423659.1 hypothetical protein [Delftia tsuruhatensis]